MSRLTPLERFLDKIGPRPDDPNDCWEWQGVLHEWGYGQFFMHRKKRNAHRVAYLFFVSEEIDGLHIDHLCRNRACVNPLHLEAVTMRENILRGEGPPAKAARLTHCKRGHEFTPENTMRRPNGVRRCGQCERERWTRENARRAKGTFRAAVHGTNSKYTRGCRCDECRLAHSGYQREYNLRKRLERVEAHYASVEDVA